MAMGTSRVCPRCWHWHDTVSCCDEVLALSAYVAVVLQKQAAADDEERGELDTYLHKPKA
jgi:hypothetical protein